MKVYFDSSLRTGAKGLPGLRQRTGWRFAHLGRELLIPAVYRFPQGLVFDLLIPLDEEALRAFYEKYQDLEEASGVLERQIEQENPCKALELRELWVNGARCEGWSYSFSPRLPEGFQEPSGELEPVVKAYRAALAGRAYFGCQRVCVPIPAESRWQRLCRRLHPPKIRSLRLVTEAVERFCPMKIQFTIRPEEATEGWSRTEQLVHPVTGETHTLWFQSAETQVVKRSQPVLYLTSVSYEVEPPLGEGERLQFDSSIQYRPPRENQFQPQAMNDVLVAGLDPAPEAASIGIIGGADGPTAIFCASREAVQNCGAHGLPLHTAFARPSLKPGQPAEVLLEGLTIPVAPSREFHFH